MTTSPGDTHDPEEFAAFGDASLLGLSWLNDGKDLELVFDEGRRLLFRGAHEVVIDLNFGDLMGAPLVFEVRRGGVDEYEVQFGGAPDGALLVKANDVEVDRGS